MQTLALGRADVRTVVNHTQALLAPLGGPVVDGPYARWGVPACDFKPLQRAVQAGQQGTGAYVIETAIPSPPTKEGVHSWETKRAG